MKVQDSSASDWRNIRNNRQAEIPIFFMLMPEYMRHDIDHYSAYICYFQSCDLLLTNKMLGASSYHHRAVTIAPYYNLSLIISRMLLEIGNLMALLYPDLFRDKVINSAHSYLIRNRL